MSLRARQAEEVRGRLLDAAMELIEDGEEPTMRSVARRGGVAERTIYRYFASRDDLAEALKPRFAARAGVPLCATADELPEYAAELYGVFEANRRLIDALVTASWAVPSLGTSRRTNLEGLRAILADGHPDARPDAVDAAASALRVLLSGAGWHYLRVGCGLEPAALAAIARWTIGVVRSGLG